jgi:uncharacterized protein DUF1206
VLSKSVMARAWIALWKDESQNPDVRSWIRSAARLGHLAIGVVYIVLGGFALGATLNNAIKPVGFQQALRRLLESRAGAVFPIIIAIGLLADGVWQAVRAALNADMADHSLQGYMERGSWIVSGLVHFGLGIVAIKLVVGIGQKPTESQVRYWTESIMRLPFGGPLIAGAGMVIIMVGVIFISRSLRREIERWLDLSSLSRTIRVIAILLGRFGVAARGVVFIAGGTLFVLAAMHVNPNEARGLGGTLRIIESQPYGHLLLACVALGFVAYGIFELACARYRRIRIPPGQPKRERRLHARQRS